MSIKNIHTHLTRLHRHYNSCVKSYDYPAMLDLVVALYNVTELIDEINHVTDKIFTVSEPHIKIKRLMKGHDHIYFDLPNPITTYTTGAQGQMREAVFFPDYLVGEGKDCTIMTRVKFGEDLNEVRFYHFFFRNKSFSKQESKIFNEHIGKTSLKKRRFTQYMNYNFIWYKSGDHKYQSMTRKDLIETVANEYNARHVKKGEIKERRYTEPVKKLMDFKLAGLVIPAFTLLHIANDILSLLTEER